MHDAIADAKRRKIIPIIKDEDASYPRVLRGINAIKLQRLKFTFPFWKLLSGSLDIKYIPKLNLKNSSLLSPSSASATSSSSLVPDSSSSLGSPLSSSAISNPSSFSKKSLPSRSFSVESFESIIDNEDVPGVSQVYSVQYQSTTASHCSNTSGSISSQKSLPNLMVNNCRSESPSRKMNSSGPLHHSMSDQGIISNTSESSCSNCSPGTVKKSSKKFVSKLKKAFRFRSKSSKSLMEDPVRSPSAPQTLRSTSEPAETLQRSFKSCDDIFNEQRRDKSKLHFVQNIVTTLKTGLSGSRELTNCSQMKESKSDHFPSPVCSSSDLQPSDPDPGLELPLNIRMNTFNFIQREYSVEGNTESAIMRSSGYSDSNTESAILRGAGSTESIDDNNAQFTLC